MVVVIVVFVIVLLALTLFSFRLYQQKKALVEQASSRTLVVAPAASVAHETAVHHEAISHAPGVCFMTDVEGNWEYFKRFIDRSEALSFVGGQAHYGSDGAAELILHDGWRLVHGGDSCDKGGVVGGEPQPCGARTSMLRADSSLAADAHTTLCCACIAGTVRVVRTLVALKKKYPDRVVLVLGTRARVSPRAACLLAAHSSPPIRVCRQPRLEQDALDLSALVSTRQSQEDWSRTVDGVERARERGRSVLGEGRRQACRHDTDELLSQDDRQGEWRQGRGSE
jgi:hypothetical protein